ncbi:MAG: AraC family transcriptional regulator [Candidatus Solibacter sp.]
MPKPGSYGKQLSDAFRAPNAPTLSTRILQQSTLAVTELRCDHSGFGRTSPLPLEDAWLVALQLRACPNQDLYFDGRLTRPENHAEGVTSIYDLRRGPVADIHDPYHSLVFYLPRTALDAMASEAGVARPDDLRHRPGTSVDDPVVCHLLSSLRPLIAEPKQANSLFLDHVVLAMTAHMASAYGGLKKDAGIPRGGLASWQERRAKELMGASLNEKLSLSRLAMECGLSARHFARAFRLSTGMPPHRWLVRLRVERAKELLQTRALSLVDVAMFSGFADQSHFTRVFKAVVGVPPDAWRRMNTVRTT